MRIPKFLAIFLLLLVLYSNLEVFLSLKSSEPEFVYPEDFFYGKTYSTASIASMVQVLDFAPARLMIYDPNSDQFLWYSIAPSESMLSKGIHCGSCGASIKLLLRSFLLHSPDRFVVGQQPFQMLMSDADFSYFNSTLILSSNSNVGSKIKNSPISDMAPMLHFGSVMKDKSILPSVHVFPFHPYLLCLDEWYFYKYDVCHKWTINITQNSAWKSLTPQMIWRGRFYKFLHTVDISFFNKENLTHVPYSNFLPRKRINELSGASPLNNKPARNMTDVFPWLNACAFRSDQYKKCYLSKVEISKYRYQLDLGGAGGTSWTGTLEKLMMPGVLFHHETPAKDWYYDRIVPWKHYIPVKTDLSNLRERYEWTVTNDEKAEKISETASRLARNILSKNTMEQEYDSFFGNRSIVAKLPSMYVPTLDETTETILTTYKTIHKLHIVGPFATCDKNSCKLRYGKNPRLKFKFKIWEPE
jgi:hypothetical protein